MSSEQKNRDRKGARVWIVPHGFKRTFTEVRGHRIHALKSEKVSHQQANGLDSPIILLHGALASRRYLMPTAKILAKNMQVCVYEMPGHGGSSKPKYALSVEEQADVMAQWFRGNEITSAYLFANSYGCQIAAALAAKYPDLLERLILSGPTVDPAAPTLIEQLIRLSADSFVEPPIATVQMHLDIADMGLGFAIQTAQQMIKNDIKPNLCRIACKTLVVRGDKDPIAPQSWLELATSIIPDAEWLVINNSPHCVNFVSPVQLSQIILQFISRP